MRLQVVITVVTAVLTVVYVVLTLPSIDLGAVSALPAGGTPAVIGALVFMLTGFGLGWVNAAADYSRYLPRSTRAGGVVWWTTFGGAVAPIVLLLFGLLLAGSSKKLNEAIYNDPIGALSTILPTWFLVPFLIVALLGLVGGAALDIYSSGLSLLSAGLRIPRYAAAAVDGVIMIAGAVFVVFFAGSFVFTFQGFLITLGVPIAAWAGIFLGDLLLRRRDYADAELAEPRGRYGSVRVGAIVLLAVATLIGWGLVTNTYADWLSWQGYLLGPIGGKEGDWAFANLGVLAALLIGFVGTLATGRGAVRRQEALPLERTR
jgi:nucleobase:cation symporter-1, NCS1 family